jgi:voltage-gated potassium channel
VRPAADGTEALAGLGVGDGVSIETRVRTLRRRLHHLYFGEGIECYRFRYAVLAFDITTIAFIIVSSFMPRHDAVERLDLAVGFVLLVELLGRLFASRKPLRELLHPITLIDIVAIASFLAPLVGEGAGFLRVLRTLRLMHSYQVVARLRQDSRWFRVNEELVIAMVHLVVFLFVMSAVVYETQHWTNPGIQNYVDALYFTVTALTTTGFGDITLAGTSGRLISVVIMICGVTLFLRLVRSLLRPNKVRFPCPSCGLQRHDPDAVHCKACGIVLNIPDEGQG